MVTAFVLGGGGVLGAVEVGMLRALLERDIVPDLVLGTSVGALNGAMVARQPELRGELQGIQWLGFALTEAVVFYGLIGGLLAYVLV